MNLSKVEYDTASSPMYARWYLTGSGSFAGATFDIPERMATIEVEKGPLPTGNEIQQYMEMLSNDNALGNTVLKGVLNMTVTVGSDASFNIHFDEATGKAIVSLA